MPKEIIWFKKTVILVQKKHFGTKRLNLIQITVILVQKKAKRVILIPKKSDFVAGSSPLRPKIAFDHSTPALNLYSIVVIRS